MMGNPYFIIYVWSGREQYWTGEISKIGNPGVTFYTGEARAFKSARDAYEVAENYPRLARFKVGSRSLMWREAA